MIRLPPTALIILLLVVGAEPYAQTKENPMAGTHLGETQLARLEAGEILVGLAQSGEKTRGSVEAVVLIRGPAEQIWKVMTDCDAAPTYVPGLKACRVLEAGDKWEVIRHEVKWLWLFPKVTYVFRADYQIHRQINFRRIAGDLREMKGRWRLRPMENGKHTLVHYSVYLDPGFFVPGWVVRRSLKKNLPAVLSALREQVQNVHQLPPDGRSRRNP